eukprot:TRINITY_DN25611_c0_g1_i1.p1 TRINITY_DN25611_c0_g1~~TRINITY_DN25611_c0_g1_i1.p1  ORF type:complete len:237 (+),score=38.53 TRINITY_DN25611_c0_g1_i1:73-783(+)
MPVRSLSTTASILRPQLQGVPPDVAEKLATFENPASNVQACIITLGVGNAGLNLQSASVLVFIDAPNRASVTKQAIGRCLRIGQKKVVQVYNIAVTDCVDDILLRISSRRAGDQVDSASLIVGDHALEKHVFDSAWAASEAPCSSSSSRLSEDPPRSLLGVRNPEESSSAASSSELSLVPARPPGEYWTRYNDCGELWWYYEGPLGKWWCSSETEDTPLRYEDSHSESSLACSIRS